MCLSADKDCQAVARDSEVHPSSPRRLPQMFCNTTTCRKNEKVSDSIPATCSPPAAPAYQLSTLPLPTLDPPTCLLPNSYPPSTQLTTRLLPAFHPPSENAFYPPWKLTACHGTAVRYCVLFTAGPFCVLLCSLANYCATLRTSVYHVLLCAVYYDALLCA